MVKTRAGDGSKKKEIRELNTNSGLDSFKYSLKISKTVSELEDNKKKNEIVELPCYDIAKTEEDDEQDTPELRELRDAFERQKMKI